MSLYATVSILVVCVKTKKRPSFPDLMSVQILSCSFSHIIHIFLEEIHKIRNKTKIIALLLWKDDITQILLDKTSCSQFFSHILVHILLINPGVSEILIEKQ